MRYIAGVATHNGSLALWPIQPALEDALDLIFRQPEQFPDPHRPESSICKAHDLAIPSRDLRATPLAVGGLSQDLVDPLPRDAESLGDPRLRDSLTDEAHDEAVAL